MSASTTATAAPAAPAVDARTELPVTPDADPFYLAPAGFEAEAPGTVLRSREVTLALLGKIKQKVAAYQLLYRTAGINGEPQVTATTVAVPRGATGSTPVVSFQAAIDSLNPASFPSYVLRHGAVADGQSIPQWEYLMVAAALRRGWIVSIPDHEGQNGNWGAPNEPGYTTLDGIRACLGFAPLGLSTGNAVAIFGYSGGGLATSWAAELAPRYAPELNLKGAALGSPVGDLGSTFVKLNNTLFTGLPTLIVSTLARNYPQIADVLDNHVTEKGRKLFFEDAPTWSTEKAIRKMAYKDLAHYADRSIEEVVLIPAVAEVLEQIRPGAHKPEVPVLVIQSTADKVISSDDVDGQVQRYRDFGTHVTYLRDRWSGHFSLHLLSAPLLLNWCANRLEGEPVPENHTRTVRTVMANRHAIVGLGRIIGASARVATGRKF